MSYQAKHITNIILVVVESLVNDDMVDGHVDFSVFRNISIPFTEYCCPKGR